MRQVVVVAVFTLGFVWACQRPFEAGLSIAGGQETSGYPEVVRISMDFERARYCTGVVVSETTLLMAAHCVKDPKRPSEIHVEMQASNSKRATAATAVYMWNTVAFKELQDDEDIARNLAVVEFASAPFSPPFAKISPKVWSEQWADTGDTAVIVGYGADRFGSPEEVRLSIGVKRVGTQTIMARSGNFYELSSPLRNGMVVRGSLAANGDAGSPLYDQAGHLIGLGVAYHLRNEDGEILPYETDSYSNRYYPETGAASAHNAFVSLSSSESIKLFMAAAQQSQEKGGSLSIPGLEPLIEKDKGTLDANDLKGLEAPFKKESSPRWIGFSGGGILPPSSPAGLLLMCKEDVNTQNGSAVSFASGFGGQCFSGGAQSGPGKKLFGMFDPKNLIQSFLNLFK